MLFPAVLVGAVPVPLFEAGGKIPPKSPSLPKRPPSVLVLEGVAVDVTGIVLVNVVDNPTKMTGVEDSVPFVDGFVEVPSFDALAAGVGVGSLSGK